MMGEGLEAATISDDVGNALGEWRNPRFDPDQVRRWAAEIGAAYREGRPPAAGREIAEWAAALNLLFLSGRLEELDHGARHLRESHPGFTFAENVCAFFDRLPPTDGLTEFRDDLSKALQVVPRQGARDVLLLFSDSRHCLGMPLSAAHRWLGRLPANLIYLRDFRRLYYLGGVAALGPDRRATLDGLRALVQSLGAGRVLCCGDSAGVFGALLYGLDLGAARVLALAGPTNLSPAFNSHLRWDEPSRRLSKLLPEARTDLRELFISADSRPHSLLVYAENNWDDRLQADWMAGVPNVVFESVPDFSGHNVAMELVRRGLFEPFLDRLCA